MKKYLVFFMAGVLGFLGARANNEGPGEGKKEDINGTVTHASSRKPLKDVTVTAYLVSGKEQVSSTSEDGTYSFDELRPGVYKFVFEKSGFKKVTREKVVVKTDDAFQLNIEMIEMEEPSLLPSPFHFY